MWPTRGRFQELKGWVRSHKVVVISAANASLFLTLACVLALLIEVSAKKEAHAQVETAAARSRDVKPSSAPASREVQEISAEKPVAPRKPAARPARPAALLEPPVRLGHRDYPVELRERSALRRRAEPAAAEPPAVEVPAPEEVPAAGTPPEGMPPEGMPSDGEPPQSAR